MTKHKIPYTAENHRITPVPEPADPENIPSISDSNGITPLEPDPTQLKTILDEESSQIRLSELESQYTGELFEETVLELVREGKMALNPVGDIVHVKYTE